MSGVQKDDRPQSISVEELDRQRRSSRVVVVDVRPQAEFRVAHVEGAVNIEAGALQQRVDELRDADLVVTVCTKGGGRSQGAAVTLRSLGVSRAVYLEGGTVGAQGRVPLHPAVPIAPTRAMVDWFERLPDPVRRFIAHFWMMGLRIPRRTDAVDAVRSFLASVPFDVEDLTLALTLRTFADYALFCAPDVADDEKWNKEVRDASRSWADLRESLSDSSLAQSFRQAADMAVEPDSELLDALAELRREFS